MKKLLIFAFLLAPFFATSQTATFQTLRTIGTSPKPDIAQMTVINVTASTITLNGAIFNVTDTVQGSIGENRVLKTDGGEFVLLFDGSELTTVIHNPKRGANETKFFYCQPLTVGKKT